MRGGPVPKSSLTRVSRQAACVRKSEELGPDSLPKFPWLPAKGVPAGLQRLRYSLGTLPQGEPGKALRIPTTTKPHCHSQAGLTLGSVYLPTEAGGSLLVPGARLGKVCD